MPIDGVTYVDSSNFGQSAPPSKELGKDDFLQLLIAQMSHQDPTEPMKNEDFVAQLAQFSSLEQMENMNGSLTESLNWDYLLSQTISNTMATSLIGRSVRADSSQVYLETAGAADIALNLDRTTQELKVDIVDSNGVVVKSITQRGMDKGDHIINWDGTDNSGVQVASGMYTVQVSATDGSGNAYSPSQFMEGKVDGIIYKDGYALLSINGQNIPLAAVSEVNEG
jgi:flagellar basal-body rod modification protein FlgD